MKRLPSVMSDIFNDTMSDVAYVSQIHVILDFPQRLNRELLSRAFHELVRKRSVFAYRFIRRFVRPYWERLDDTVIALYTDIPRQTVFESDIEGETGRFLALPMEHQNEPQARALLLAHQGGERLCLKINHMAADAAGVKEFAYALAHLYSVMEVVPDFVLSPERGSRNLTQVFRDVLPKKAPALLRSYISDVHQSFKYKYALHYPSDLTREGELQFLFHTFSPEGIEAVGELTRRYQATINDVMLTALVHAVIGQQGYRSGEAIRIMGTVDLRRYIPSGVGETFTNLSSFFFPCIGEYKGESFQETLSHVKETMDSLKDNNIGLGWIFGSIVALSAYPFGVKRQIIHAIFKKLARDNNTGLTLTNLGQLDKSRLKFGEMYPSAGVVVVPGCIPPTFFMGLSGFNGGLTLSMGFYSSAMDGQALAALMDSMEQTIIAG